MKRLRWRFVVGVKQRGRDDCEPFIGLWVGHKPRPLFRPSVWTGRTMWSSTDGAVQVSGSRDSAINISAWFTRNLCISVCFSLMCYFLPCVPFYICLNPRAVLPYIIFASFPRFVLPPLSLLMLPFTFYQFFQWGIHTGIFIWFNTSSVQLLHIYPPLCGVSLFPNT